MKFKNKIGLIVGMLALGVAGVVGCSPANEEDVNNNETKPYEKIQEVVDFDSSPEEIMLNYTSHGIDMLRMGFPDKLQRDYAVTLIGKHAPDVTFTTLSGKEISLLEQTDKPTILNISKTGNAVTEEMAPYLNEFELNHDDLNIITMYPYDSVKDVEAFYEKQGVELNEDTVMVGEGNDNSIAIVEAFDAQFVPSLFYIDESQTISYVAIGFRDLVYLEDYVNVAFGEEKFYDYIAVPIDENEIEK